MPAAPATETEMAEALDRSVRYALETMCFAEAVPAPAAVGVSKCAMVPFRASFAGKLNIAITPAGAQTLTSSLLGLEPGETPDEVLVNDTVCELGSVICGRFLSSLDPSTRLHIGRAQLETNGSAAAPDLRLGFRIERGQIAVSLQLD